MIIGIGQDVVEIARVQRILGERAGDRFMSRVLTPGEYALCESKSGRVTEFLAGRFAAKEAVSKALGCGIGSTLGLHDIELLPDERGKPICRLSAAAWQRLGLDECSTRLHVSISHERTIAMALAVVEQVQPSPLP